jgi:hypothetical protein
MTNRLLLVLPVLLTLSACRHLPTRPTTPTQEEIQREAPAGGLVRVTLRDQQQPYRFTSYLVDVSRDEIVDKVDGSTREELEGQASGEQKSGSAATGSYLLTSVEVVTDCRNPEPEPGCGPDMGAWNGDPRGTSGGGGDPTGHDPLLRIRRLAALSFWSVRQVGIPFTQKPMTRPAPTHGK